MWDDTVLKYITVLKSTAHCTQTQCTVLTDCAQVQHCPQRNNMLSMIN